MYILDNPEFIRLTRSKLRSRNLITFTLIGFVIFGGTIGFTYLAEQSTSMRWGTSRPINMPHMFHLAFDWIVGIQLAMMSLYGMALAAQNVTIEKERGTIDFQRLVAMGPLRLTIGKVFGASVESFFLAAVGIPFAFIAALGSDIPISASLQCEIVVFASGIVACSFGLMCSTLVEKTNQATGIMILLGIPFSAFLANWNPQSVWATANPVFLLNQFLNQGSSYWRDSNFTFFSFHLPLLIGFTAVSSMLIALSITIAARRIADAELAFLTPKQGLIAFAILQFILLGDVGCDSTWSGLQALQWFHFIDLAAILALAFALTPSAELVRGRVQRAQRDGQWGVVFERTNRLQDSPAIRAMLEVCMIYFASSFACAMFASALDRSPTIPQLPAVLLIFMNASIGIATVGLLLYIQVYMERGCFKLGLLFVLLAFAIPPFLAWLPSTVDYNFGDDLVKRVSPIAYLVQLGKLSMSEVFVCPLICVVLAAAFVILSGMRIRFLLDVQDMLRKRVPQKSEEPTLRERMKAVQVASAATVENKEGTAS